MFAMDRAFCEEVNKEFESLRSKQRQEQERQAQEARNKR